MKWNRVISREYSVQYCEVALRTLSEEVKQFLPYTLKKQFIIPEHTNECFYLEETEFKKLMDGIVKKYTSDQDTFEKFVSLFHELGKKYIEFCKEINQKDLVSLSNSELKEIYAKYQNILIEYSCVGVWVGYLLNSYWTKQGLQMLKTDDDKIKEALFRPEKKSTVVKMQLEAAEVKGNETKIKAFFEKYQWLLSLDVHKTTWSLQAVKEYIADIKPIKHSKQLSFEEAAKDLNEEEIRIFKMIKELAYIKDARDDYRRQGIFMIQPFFIEIGTRMGIGIKEIAYLTEEEIINFLDDKKIDVSKGKLRKQKGFMMYVEDQKVKLIEDDFEQEMQKQGFVIEKISIQQVKGSVACKGNAKGRVVIVRTIHDILKVKKGDVLVAVTTHPDYVPAMQKAVAIVTDEGGILSHAAIVSRELNIPCIVGTKNATKVLEPGQEVKVDAINGVVKVV